MPSAEADIHEMLDRLRQYDTPTICNVIELFDVRPRNAGYLDGRIRCCFPDLPVMVGYACTATFRSNAPPRGSDAYTSLEDQVAQFASLPGPAVVVFQDLDDPPVAATFGEVMCTTYKAFGAAGIITSGGGRDLDQVHRLGFPAFVGSVICSHGYCHVPQIGVPVHVGGVTLYPGDLLHGDRNGVTTIPLEIAPAVSRLCRDFVAAEEEMMDAIRRRSPTLEALSSARKKLVDRFKALAVKARNGA